MRWGHELIAWRAYKGLSQTQLAKRAGLTRAYLARLEAEKGNPSLSVLRGLAFALDISIGTLLEGTLPASDLSNEDIDQLARATYHPGRKSHQHLPYIRVLPRLFQNRRAALGLYRPRKKKSAGRPQTGGRRAERRLRVVLGEKTWAALLRRIDKHAAFQKGTPRL